MNDCSMNNSQLLMCEHCSSETLFTAERSASQNSVTYCEHTVYSGSTQQTVADAAGYSTE